MEFKHVFITSDKSYLNVEWPWGYRETDKLEALIFADQSSCRTDNL